MTYPNPSVHTYPAVSDPPPWLPVSVEWFWFVNQWQARIAHTDGLMVYVDLAHVMEVVHLIDACSEDRQEAGLRG